MGGLFSRILPRGCQTPVDDAVAVGDEAQQESQNRAGGNQGQSHLATIYEDGHRQTQDRQSKSRQQQQRPQATSWPSEEQAIAGPQQPTQTQPQGYQSIGGGANGGQANRGYVTTPDLEAPPGFGGPQDKIPAMVAQQSLGLDRQQFSQQALINREFLQRKRSREEKPAMSPYSPTSVTAPAPALYGGLPGASPPPTSPVTAPAYPTSASMPFSTQGEPHSAPPVPPKPTTKPLGDFEWHETTTTTDSKIVEEPPSEPGAPDHVRSVTHYCESMRALIDSSLERPLMTDFTSSFKKEVDEGEAPAKKSEETSKEEPVNQAKTKEEPISPESSIDRTKTESSITSSEPSPSSKSPTGVASKTESKISPTTTSASALAPDAPIIPPPYLFCDYRDDAKDKKTSASITLKAPEQDNSGLASPSSQGPPTPAPTLETPSPADGASSGLEEDVLPSPEIKSAVAIFTQSSVIESKPAPEEAVAIANQVVQSVIEEATSRLAEATAANQLEPKSLADEMDELTQHLKQPSPDRSPRAVSEPPRQIPLITETRASIPGVDEEEAAVKIQAAFRGYRVRKGQSTQEYEDMVEKEPAIVYYRESTEEIKDIEEDPTIRNQQEQPVSEPMEVVQEDNVLVPVTYASVESPMTAEAIRLTPTPERQLGDGDTDEIDLGLAQANGIEQMNGEALQPQEAATRIQAAFRGFQVRKSRSRDPSPNVQDRRPTEEDVVVQCQSGAQVSQAPQPIPDGQQEQGTDQQIEAEAIQTLDQLEEHLVEQLRNQRIDDQDMEILELINDLTSNRQSQAQPEAQPQEEPPSVTSSAVATVPSSDMLRGESIDSDVVVIGQEAVPPNEPQRQMESDQPPPTETVTTPPPEMISSLIEPAVDQPDQGQIQTDDADWFGARQKVVEEGFGAIGDVGAPAAEPTRPEAPPSPSLTPHPPSDAQVVPMPPTTQEQAEVIEQTAVIQLRPTVSEHKESPKPVAQGFDDDVRQPSVSPQPDQAAQEIESSSKEKKSKRSRSKKTKGARPDAERFKQPSPSKPPVVELPPIVEPEPTSEPVQAPTENEPVGWTQIAEHRRASMHDEPPQGQQQETVPESSVAWTELLDARRESLKDDAHVPWTDVIEARRESLKLEQDQQSSQPPTLDQLMATQQAELEAQNAAIAMSMIAAATAIQSEDEAAQSAVSNAEIVPPPVQDQSLGSCPVVPQQTQQSPASQESRTQETAPQVTDVIVEPPPLSEQPEPIIEDNEPPLIWSQIGEIRRASLREEQAETQKSEGQEPSQEASLVQPSEVAPNAQIESTQQPEQQPTSSSTVTSSLNPDAPEFQFTNSPTTASPWAEAAKTDASKPSEPQQTPHPSGLDAFDMASFTADDLLSSENPLDMMTDDILTAMEQQALEEAPQAPVPGPAQPPQAEPPSPSGRSRQVEQQLPGPVLEAHLNGSTKSETVASQPVPEAVSQSLLTEEVELPGLQEGIDVPQADIDPQQDTQPIIMEEPPSPSISSPISDELNKTLGSPTEESSDTQASATSPDSLLSPSEENAAESLPTDSALGSTQAEDDDEVAEGSLAPPFANTRRSPSPYTGKKNKRRKKKGGAQAQSRFS